uniref:Thiazole synthase n=1 Tax=Sciadococcus taiwanensis TaxID=3028030 RepID=A0A9Y1I221_9RHOD|nr:thiamin biosynthesis protein G [Sciadococcus taiwanensis]
MMSEHLNIGNKHFNSRLLLGTGKYKNLHEAKLCIEQSECEIVTVAVRRAKNSLSNSINSLIHILDWSKLTILPNTAGCQTAQEAIRVAELSQALVRQIGQPENKFIKLEVIPDPKYLLPDPIGTLEAAEYLVKKGFIVLPYINADPILAKQLEEIGCATVMPLGSPIGSGQGLQNLENIKIIVENSKVPVIVDAGIGIPSEATQAMELGVDGVLINTAIAQAQSSSLMAEAMKLSVISGYKAYLAGRMKKQDYAQLSSPSKGGII